MSALLPLVGGSVVPILAAGGSTLWNQRIPRLLEHLKAIWTKTKKKIDKETPLQLSRKSAACFVTSPWRGNQHHSLSSCTTSEKVAEALHWRLMIDDIDEFPQFPQPKTTKKCLHLILDSHPFHRLQQALCWSTLSFAVWAAFTIFSGSVPCLSPNRKPLLWTAKLLEISPPCCWSYTPTAMASCVTLFGCSLSAETIYDLWFAKSPTASCSNKRHEKKCRRKSS